jgi:acyl phosphate:glycerol-3-phosphate acyltransferase
MNAHPILISAVCGYLLGSIPFGYLLVRIFRGADVRATGSGNVGATNVARTSPVLGLFTLFLDAIKGVAAVGLVLAVFPDNRTLAFITALSAIIGHVFPLWLGFRGGKGVATGLGSFLLLTPRAILIAIGIFLVIAALFRWIALASVVGTGLLPLLSWLSGESQKTTGVFEIAGHRLATTPLLWISASALLIITKHHSNIRRMLAGTEPRFHLKHK